MGALVCLELKGEIVAMANMTLICRIFLWSGTKKFFLAILQANPIDYGDSLYYRGLCSIGTCMATDRLGDIKKGLLKWEKIPVVFSVNHIFYIHSTSL